MRCVSERVTGREKERVDGGERDTERHRQIGRQKEKMEGGEEERDRQGNGRGAAERE